MPKLELKQTIEVCDTYDVIVAGGGPAGCAAAASAAREGAKTLLIEASYMLGGMGTGGLVPSWCPFSDHEKIIYRGMAETILNAAKAQSPHIMPQDLTWVPIDSEVLKRVYDDFVGGYGVDVLFGTQLCAVNTDGAGRVTEIVVSNKDGLKAYRAKVYADCTGDADLAVWAGAEFDQGDVDGTLMPASLCFVLTNVDGYAYRYDRNSGLCFGSMHGTNPKSVIHAIAADDAFPLVTDTHFCHQIIGPGTVGFNAGHVFNVDSTDPVSVSKAMMQGRELAHQLHEGLKKYFPTAFANSLLVSTAPLMGIREGRRIKGAYTLTLEDYIERRSFPDEISRNCYYIDVHLTKEEERAAAENGISREQLDMRYQKGESHGIPYRSLLPKDLVNVIVAGRSISCDRKIQGSVRVMPNCLCTGEAAGMAAARASMSDGNVHHVDTDALRTALREAGAYFL